MICLAVDLLGADTAEEELCRGALAALRERDDLSLYLCGHAERLRPCLSEADIRRADIVDAAEITNHDNPMLAYKREDASLVRALGFVKSGQADGVVTCGSTGAVLVSSLMLLGSVHGLRPILAVELKGATGAPFLLLDCGANIDSRAELYVSYAKLGHAYMRSIGEENPRISLLSNGAEKTKGCEAVKAAHELLEKEPFHFIGNIEPNHALLGETDVIVCDGFHGNILLKSIEGTAGAVLGQVKAALPDTPEVASALASVRRMYDYNTQGGALLLGVRGLVMKGHGAATGDAVKHMLLRAATLTENGFLSRVDAAF